MGSRVWLMEASKEKLARVMLNLLAAGLATATSILTCVALSISTRIIPEVLTVKSLTLRKNEVPYT